MSNPDLGQLLKQCMENNTKPNPSNYSEDIEMILNALGAQSCETSSTSACTSVKVGWGPFGSGGKACAGTEYSKGCEQILANFNRTRIAKESLNCAIRQRIQESNTQVIQSNSIKINAEGAECCKCENNEDGCLKYDPVTDKLTRYECKAIGALSQVNVADVKSSTIFTLDESEDVTREILTSFSEDVNLAADAEKEGVGADVGQKIINVSDIEQITNDRNINVAQNVQKTLNRLNQENITEINLAGMSSVGGCLDEINQENIIKLVVNNVMGEVLSSVRKSVDKSTYDKVVDATLSKKLKGTDITAGSTAGDGIDMMTILILLLAVGGLYMFFKFKGSLKVLIQSTTGEDPKAMTLSGIIVGTFFILFLIWLYAAIQSLWKWIKSGFGIFKF